MTSASNPPSLTSLAQGWCVLSALHLRIQAHVEAALLEAHNLTCREFSLLTVLSRQHDGPGGHLHMKQVADAVVLSQSATTRLVTRLEERELLARFLCPTDRRGIYTKVTPAGRQMLNAARPTHDRALQSALTAASLDPELQPLVSALSDLGIAAAAQPCRA